MKALLIDDEQSSRGSLSHALQERGFTVLLTFDTIQKGLEALEASPKDLNLAVCNYRGASQSLLTLFVQLTARVPAILLGEGNEQAAQIPREARLDILPRADEAALFALLEKLKNDGSLQGRNISDAGFIAIPTVSLVLSRPLRADIYLRLAPNRYCKRFHRDDEFDADDLEQSFLRHNIPFLYVPKSQVDALLDVQILAVDAALESEDNAARLKLAEENLEIIQDAVAELGFTPAVQELAKRTVELTVKAIGGSPHLADVMKKMRLQEGKYITSHSMMLAEIACAIAHRIGWSSGPTFMKLTLAAFLHDLPLDDNRLARMKSPAEVTNHGAFTPEQLKAYKMHPAHAADYARVLHQIPPDVDNIVMQHHERPDGSGFPRGLYHHQMSPLSCIFIVAHDMLDFYLEKRPANPSTHFLDAFLFAKEAEYGSGTFKEITQALVSGVPFTL